MMFKTCAEDFRVLVRQRYTRYDKLFLFIAEKNSN